MPKTIRDWPRHAREHLRASGLEARDAERLGLEWLTAARAARVLHLEGKLPCGGILFPYHDAEGRERAHTLRVRLLPDPREGWEGAADLPRYLQPPGSAPAAYLPRLADWTRIRENGRTVLVTEGEKKAAAACKAGLPCVGLGGVWSFGIADLGVDLLPELDAIGWKDRRAVVAFDSDWRDNKDVRKAALVLARRLAERGADVRMLTLDHGRNALRVGLDDFLVAHGAAALRKAVEAAPSLDPSQEKLADYRRRFVLVRTLSCAWDRETEALYTRSRLKDSFPEDRIVTLGPTGRPNHRTKAEAWWDDPRKVAVDARVLRPGEPEVTADGHLNLFKGWGAPPREGDTRVWEELLSIVFQGDAKAIAWFERWLAYPLQHPGAKLHQAVFVYGGQGVGKSSIGRVMLDIYGPSGRSVQDRELFAGFNGWIAQTLFAMGDDLCFEEKRKSRSVIKMLVDSETLEVNEKYIPSYSVENRCNFYLTANSPGALPLDPSGLNRRFLVVEGPQERTREKRWYTQVFDRWRKEGGAAFVHHRLRRMNLGGFHPQQDAPGTEAKSLVVETSRSGVEAWVATDLLDACPYQLAAARELHALYKAVTGDARTGIGAFTAALRSTATPLGLHRLGQSEVSLFALRERERWKAASRVARVRQYKQERGAT